MKYSVDEIEKMIQGTYEETFFSGSEVNGFEFINKHNCIYMKTQWDAPFLNGVLSLDDKSGDLKQRIKLVHEELKTNGKPYIWRFDPSLMLDKEVEDYLLDLGLVESQAHTSVYSELNNELFNSYQFENKLNFTKVDLDNFDHWYSVFSDAFEVPKETLEFFIEYEKLNALKDKASYQSYIGYSGEKAVAIVSSVVTKSPLGALFNIATRKDERGKSFGMQASLFGAQELFKAGKTMVGQFGSELGVVSYTKLGAKLGNKYKTFYWGP